MAMKQCPVCGEEYSETYPDCPFCEEEAVLREGGQLHRGGKRLAGGQQPGILSPMLVVVVVVLALLLIYLLFGDDIAAKLKGEEPPAQTPVVDDVLDPVPPQIPIIEEDPAAPEIPDTTVTPPAETELDYAAAAALPAGLTLSTTDFTLQAAGETHTITVTGGGTYQWFSQDEGIAAVDENGKVTAISGGTVNIVVTDGAVQGTCIVRNRFSGSIPAPATPDTGGSGGEHKLNNTDFTRPISEGGYQLRVSGVTTAITWTSSNTAVATVSDSGLVTPVGAGTATITASWDGKSLSSIIRVPG